SIRAIRAFYGWAQKQDWAHVVQDPTAGIKRLPFRSPGIRIRTRDADLYEALLGNSTLSSRDQAILILLAMGLTPADVANLRIQDVDLSFRRLTVARRQRKLPASDKVTAFLGRYMATRPGDSCSFLFVGTGPRRRLSSSAIRAVVRHAG